jgi:predicted acylesterase/phospholipase RssA
MNSNRESDAVRKVKNILRGQSATVETTARQLAALARLQAAALPDTTSLQQTPAWQVVCDFLGEKYANGIQGIFLGKVGLALSGGGFRASLFHLGVLARLAELDILRHVEVLSCVSGGSIIGAHYYSELRKLLQSKSDDQITKDDYIAIVGTSEQNFLAGVQRNIRMRVLADFSANLRMIFTPNTYSRTQRAGELYEEEIYSRVKDGNGTSPRYMNDLLIQPAGESPRFSPKMNNWRRAAKVPTLILNATALNTGHNWQFTATWMGEPPAGVDAEIDSNYRLRRMYYDEAPQEHRKVRLGHAVAASACVPGLFDPIVFPNLYPNLTVRLVDGGVHDNQGVASLLEQGCSVLLVSDASGQMAAQDEPSTSVLGPPLRSNSILQARVREAQYHELDARRRASLLRGVLFLHLKKDLESHSLNWIDCEDPQDAHDDVFAAGSQGVLTPYGVRKDVQECLAAIRTDLDSFSDKEAYALMTSGYRMTECEVDKSLRHLFPPTAPQSTWNFLAIESALKEREEAKELKRYLGVSSELFLKVWRLLPVWQQRALVALLVVPTLAVFFWVCLRQPSFPLLTLGMVGSIAATIIAGLLGGKTIVRVVRFRDTLMHIAVGIGMALFGCFLARLHLFVFDPWYLRLGKVRLGKKQ